MLEVEVVGSSSDRVLYIVFKNDEEIVPNSLYRLQHPGMLTVERWNSAMFKQSGEDIKVDTATRTKNFFKECVYPVNEPVSSLEEELIAHYGKNTGGKPDPETISPKYHSLWHRVMSRFLDGSLWNELPESKPSSDVERNSKSSSQKSK